MCVHTRVCASVRMAVVSLCVQLSVHPAVFSLQPTAEHVVSLRHIFDVCLVTCITPRCDVGGCFLSGWEVVSAALLAKHLFWPLWVESNYTKSVSYLLKFEQLSKGTRQKNFSLRPLPSL